MTRNGLVVVGLDQLDWIKRNQGLIKHTGESVGILPELWDSNWEGNIYLQCWWYSPMGFAGKQNPRKKQCVYAGLYCFWTVASIAATMVLPWQQTSTVLVLKSGLKILVAVQKPLRLSMLNWDCWDSSFWTEQYRALCFLILSIHMTMIELPWLYHISQSDNSF